MLQAMLRQDRAMVLGGLVVVILLAWAYLLLGAGIDMDRMAMGGAQAMLMPSAWTWGYAVMIFLMWSIMMAAMMLPGAAPVILLVSALGRTGPGRGATAALFGLGYLLVWISFSLAATALQWSLDTVGLLSNTMAIADVVVAGIVLISAGVYQWTPLKQACLLHCRSPLAYLLNNWKRGAIGAVTNGMRHGTFCLGCCWMLMLLLFVGGLMNLLWIAGLALIVLVEKLMPWGGRMSRVTGVILIGSGIGVLFAALWLGGQMTA